MARLSRRFWTRLTVSLIVASAVVVPAAVVGTQALERHRQLDRLGHPDPGTRERALNYLIREVPGNDSLRDAALARFPGLPGDALWPLVTALKSAGVDDAELADALQAQVGRLPHTAFAAAFALLAEHQHPPVNVAIVRLESATTSEQRQELITLLDRHRVWRSPPVPLDVYVAWIARGLEAQTPALRRETARQLGDLSPTQPNGQVTLVRSPLRKLLVDPDPTVRIAALSALAGFVPQNPEFLDDIAPLHLDTDPEVAGWAMRLTDAAHGRYAGPNGPANIDLPPTEANRLALWRGVLRAPDTEPTRRRWRQLLRDLPTGAAWRPVRYAALFRLGAAPPEPYENSGDWERLLAGLEGSPPGSAALRFTPDMPHLLRPAAVRAAHNAELAWLAATFRLNDRPAARDRACLVAAQRFDEETLRALIRELLADHDPDARVSGAVLAGMTGFESSRLDETTPNETDPAALRLMWTAQWMLQPDRPGLAPSASRLLGREGLPDSTFMLMFLHRGERRVALDHLLQSPDAAELLRTRRWADVLHAYLPDDAPRLSVWADDEWFAQQLEDLRAWYALHRHTPARPAGGAPR